MRILVFGTSNSILKNGYVDALRTRPDISRLDRIGLGGSPSIMLPYVGTDVIFGEYDYVVLDCSVNDGSFLGWNLLQPAEVRENVLWICKAALQAGCVPVFLCMPAQSHLDGDDPALKIYREIATEFQFALIDGYAFAKATAIADDIPAVDLFMDELHLRPDVAARLVPQIIAACQPHTRGDIPDPGVRFRLIQARDLALPQCRRETPLMAVDCAELSQGQKVTLHLSAGETICGTAYNAGHTFGSLIFEGDTKTAINVRSHYFQKNALVASVRQISPSLSPKDGEVQVYVQRADGVIAEILGFVVRCEAGADPDAKASDVLATRSFPSLTFPPLEADLVTELYGKARVIVEYGSGGSTVLAARQPGVTTFSIESDQQWAQRLQETLDRIHGEGTVHLIHADIGPTGDWGFSTDQTHWKSFIHYPMAVWERPDLSQPDLVLIDGRFRVGCFLATLINITRPTAVLFDDYRDRPQYHVVEELLRPSRIVGRMAVFEVLPRQLSPHELRRFGAYFFDQN